MNLSLNISPFHLKTSHPKLTNECTIKKKYSEDKKKKHSNLKSGVV